MSSCSKGSGVAQVVVRYYQHLCTSLQFDFLLFSRVENNFENEIKTYGGKCFYITPPSINTMSVFKKELNDFFDHHRGEYDAVQLHDLYLNPFVLKVAKEKGVRVRIAHSHTTEYSERFLPRLRNRLLYMTLHRYANVFFACSRDAGVFAFGKDVVKDSNFYLVNNAIDISQYVYSPLDRERIRKSLNYLPEDVVVGNVGRFSPQKNHTFLIKVFSELCKKSSNYKLLLVGGGNGISSAKKLCEDLLISDKVQFLGIRQDVGSIMSAMDVFCFPSIFEGLGIVLIEAQANSLPCIASSVVPKEASILPSFKTLSLNTGINDWANTILNVSLKRDPNAFEKVSNAGYNLSNASKELLEIYSRL